VSESADELCSSLELRNFEEILAAIKPAEQYIPRLDGMDIHGVLTPLKGSVGGDHIIYLDFNLRYDLDARIEAAVAEGRAEVAERLRLNKRRAGILLADVSGHSVTDAVIAAMLHQSFLLGTYYEMDMFGEITTRLFEHINTRFYKTASVNKYFTMIYGEISNEGRFRFISAAHQPPVVFSRRYKQIVPMSPSHIVSFPPIGMLPSDDDAEQRYPSLVGYKKRYTVNEINLLGSGDVLLLHTDGLSEHAGGDFFPGEVEQCLLEADALSAKTTCLMLQERINRYGTPSDDYSFVVIKKA
jgi:serine phosphatase RsbU (regulator of sigma subunit)